MVPAGLVKGVKDSSGPETWSTFLVVRGQGSHLISEAHVTSGVFRADLECGPVCTSTMYDLPPTLQASFTQCKTPYPGGRLAAGPSPDEQSVTHSMEAQT